MAKAKEDAADGETPKKTHMVHAAMEAMGYDATPSDIQPWVKKNYGIEIDKQTISSYASNIRKKMGGGRSGAVRVGKGGRAGGISVRDIGTIKGLINDYGEKELTGIIRLLAK